MSEVTPELMQLEKSTPPPLIHPLPPSAKRKHPGIEKPDCSLKCDRGGSDQKLPAEDSFGQKSLPDHLKTPRSESLQKCSRPTSLTRIFLFQHPGQIGKSLLFACLKWWETHHFPKEPSPLLNGVCFYDTDPKPPFLKF